MTKLQTKLLLIVSILGLTSCMSVPSIEMPSVNQSFPDFDSFIPFVSHHETPKNIYNKKPGFLSEKFESGSNNPGIIGKSKNKKGQYIYAYGSHQLCFENIKKFIAFLGREAKYKEYYTTLNNAGGYTAALKGNKEFQLAWRKIAIKDSKKFSQAQDEFMYQDYLRPRFKNLQTKLPKLDLNQLHPIIVECLISTMVQHGDYIFVIKEAINNDYDNINSEEFINRLYKVRKNYAGGSRLIAKRYLEESNLAISLLPFNVPSEKYLKIREKIFISKNPETA